MQPTGGEEETGQGGCEVSGIWVLRRVQERLDQGDGGCREGGGDRWETETGGTVDRQGGTAVEPGDPGGRESSLEIPGAEEQERGESEESRRHVSKSALGEQENYDGPTVPCVPSSRAEEEYGPEQRDSQQIPKEAAGEVARSTGLAVDPGVPDTPGQTRPQSRGQEVQLGLGQRLHLLPG